MSMPPPALPKSKSPKPKSSGPGSSNLRPDHHEPVAPAVLAEAISKLDSLRVGRTPSVSSTTSPASSCSSPSEKAVIVAAASVLDAMVVSVPGTPHFGAQSEM